MARHTARKNQIHRLDLILMNRLQEYAIERIFGGMDDYMNRGIEELENRGTKDLFLRLPDS